MIQVVRTMKADGSAKAQSTMRLNLLLDKLNSVAQSNPKQFTAQQRQCIGILSNILSPDSPSAVEKTTESKDKEDTSPPPITCNAIKTRPSPMITLFNTQLLSHAFTAQQLLTSLKATSPKLPSLPSACVFVTAYESYRMRRILSNILLILFREHPNGVLETELSAFYEQSYHEKFVMFNDLKYLLTVHKYIQCTRTAKRGALYTLNSKEVESCLREFDSQTLSAAIVYHIEKIFRCFPNGIDSNCFEEVFYKMVGFRLSKLVPFWFKFLTSIPYIYCIQMNDWKIFVQMNHLNQLKVKKQFIGDDATETTEKIKSVLANNLNINNVLTHCYGYEELLMVLFDQLNGNNNGVDGMQTEQLFYKLYKNRLIYEAPFMRPILENMCDIAMSSNCTALFRLSKQYTSYIRNTIHEFGAVVNRELDLSTTSPAKQKPLAAHNNINANAISTAAEPIIKSPFSADHSTVFMGGFGRESSKEELEHTLYEMGVTVVTCSKISYKSYGYAFVTLSTAKECDYLISISPLFIMGRTIDIRPYIDRYKVSAFSYQTNKPTPRHMVASIREFIDSSKSQSLSIADIQSRLFRKYAYRINGPELIQLVSTHSEFFYVRKLPGGNSKRIFNRKSA